MTLLRALLCAACVAAGACTVRNATGPGEVAPVAGTWSYDAAQVAPSAAQATGTLVLTVAADGSIAGTAALVETAPGSASRSLAGQVSGRALDPTDVELTLTVGGVAEEHFGALRGDTLSGTWVVTDGAAAGASGRFTAVRTAP